MDIKMRIISLLGQKDLSAKDIAVSLNKEKVEINRILYDDNIFVQKPGTPPIWSLANQTTICAKKSEGNIDTVVLIDLGNSPQCLKEVEPYAQAGEVLVYALCDFAYMGYGMNGGFGVSNTSVIKIAQQKKGAVSTFLMWLCFRIINRCSDPILGISLASISKLSTEKPIKILVASKDQGFPFLEDIIMDTGNILKFHRDWNTLKLDL